MKRTKNSSTAGFAQLTLVEHCLCPLDTSVSLQPGQTHRTQFSFSRNGQRDTGSAELHLPLGLSPRDEFYLWGLLALTLRQPEAEAHFAATPHYCLRQLGVIDTGSGRGGRNYELFRESLKRLSAATYQCDQFYDPVRREHCRVSFGFLSYRLPLGADSNRLWHFYWDPVFFEFCRAHGGRLSFDLQLYRRLSPAGRRLFLLLHKVFHRRKTSPVFDVRRLCEDVLGFSHTLSNGALNRKLQRITTELRDLHIITDAPQESTIQSSNGQYTIRFHRGAAFENRVRAPERLAVGDSSLTDALISLGFDSRDAGRVRTRYTTSLLREWIDITIAAVASDRVRSTPQAYLVDNLKHATTGNRAAPDWWLEQQRREDRSTETEDWAKIRMRLGKTSPAASPESKSGLHCLKDLLT